LVAVVSVHHGISSYPDHPCVSHEPVGVSVSHEPVGVSVSHEPVGVLDTRLTHDKSGPLFL